MPPVNTFHRSVTLPASGPLDRSRGRVQLINGNLFYSPNSARNVQLPPVYKDIPFRDSSKHDFTEFRQPLWWQPACPYLAFLPLRPVFAGVPFHELFHVPSFFPRLRSGFMLDNQIILRWAVIEKDIKDAIEMLLIHEQVSQVTWISRSALGCTGPFRQAYLLRGHVINTRNWFTMWMAGLSYAIALSITIRNEGFQEEMPHWFSFLSSQGWSQIWLSGIRSSPVASFDPSIDRVGVFVQVLQPHREQYSVDWLCKFAVPVWYPWGRREAEAALTDHRLARYAPLPHQLQETGTFLTKNPAPEPMAPQPEPEIQAFDCMSLVFNVFHNLIYLFFRCGIFSCYRLLEGIF